MLLNHRIHAYKGTASSSPFLAEESSVSPISSGIYSTGLNQASSSSALSSVFSTNAITTNGVIAPSLANNKPTNNSTRRGPGRPRKPPAQLPRKSRVVKRTRGGGNSGICHQLQQCHHPLSTPLAAGHSQQMQTQDNNTKHSFMSNMMLPSPIHEDGSCPFDNDSANTTPNNITSSSSSSSTPTTTTAIVSSSGSGMLVTVSSSNAITTATEENSEADSKSSAWIREIVIGSADKGSEKALEKVSTGAKVMLPPEELPYFPEKWPGKVCAMCCLGERSQLGQGEMLRIQFKNSDQKAMTASTTSLAGAGSSGSLHEFSQMSQEEEKSPRGSSNQQTQLSNRRQKGLNKCK